MSRCADMVWPMSRIVVVVDLRVSASCAIFSEVAPILLRPVLDESDGNGVVDNEVLQSRFVRPTLDQLLEIVTLPPFGLHILTLIAVPIVIPIFAFWPEQSSTSRFTSAVARALKEFRNSMGFGVFNSTICGALAMKVDICLGLIPKLLNPPP